MNNFFTQTKFIALSCCSSLYKEEWRKDEITFWPNTVTHSYTIIWSIIVPEQLNYVPLFIFYLFKTFIVLEKFCEKKVFKKSPIYRCVSTALSLKVVQNNFLLTWKFNMINCTNLPIFLIVTILHFSYIITKTLGT